MGEGVGFGSNERECGMEREWEKKAVGVDKIDSCWM